jgi:hypothetical protein
MRKRVSGEIAIREWACSISESRVVPDRGHPKMKIGRFEATGRVS